MSASRRGRQDSTLACRSFRAAMKELRGLRTRASVRQRKGSGPVNPSLLAATKELRACEPEPPCGNEKASGFCRTGGLVQGISVGFLVAFSRGRSGTRGLRIPSAVSARRDAPEGGRKVGVRTSERVGLAWSPSRSCSRFYSRLPSSSRPSSPTSATMWVAPACSSSSREP